MQERSPMPSLQRAAFFAGLLIWALALAGLVLLYASDRTQAVAAFLAVTTFYYAGQFGAMPMGLAAGGDPWLVALYVWAADAAGLLAFFPLTQLGVERLAEKRNLVARWIQRLRNKAQARRHYIERYGPLGLFAFTCLPFLFNSPILGAALGRVAGLDPRRILVALLSAVSLMSIVWTLVFWRALQAAEVVDERLPWILALGSVAITFVIAAILALLRRRTATA